MNQLSIIKDKINQNQEVISSFGTFDDNILKKINYKLRLDWNYYSNRMEGGTLTREETRSVMIGNIDVKGKPFKDVVEMTGHDKIVLEVLKMSKGELRISEKRIREIHSSIMYEEDLTKKEEIGKWKSNPNEIINYKNEKIAFTPPSEVADAIHELLNKLNTDLDLFFKNKLEKSPLEVVSQFHIDFVSIHPFYDGNGRTTRILTNILLMVFGYPAIIIKENHKKTYYQYLADIQVYGGQTDLFYEFVGERILESQKLVLDALNGLEIDEVDDIDKEILLWKQQLSSDAEVVKRSDKKIEEVYLNSIRSTIKLFISKNQQFEDLFSETRMDFFIGNIIGNDIEYLDGFFNHLNDSKIDKEKKRHSNPMLEALNLPNERIDLNIYSSIQNFNNFSIKIYFKGFKKNGVESFDKSTSLNFKFDEFNYTVSDYENSGTTFFKKLYSEQITVNEQEILINERVKILFEDIKSTIDRINNI